ncbi:MAG: hypothetical protein H0X36_11280 [Sphingomonadaceae bacterium]|nr:hypothetical protein [Sphingomonadaceae bacterium]
MFVEFIFGWCGSVPISVLIAYLIRHHGTPPQPDPWPILITNVLAGLAAVGASLGGVRGASDIAAVASPLAIGVVVGGIVGVGRTAIGRTG